MSAAAGGADEDGGEPAAGGEGGAEQEDRGERGVLQGAGAAALRHHLLHGGAPGQADQAQQGLRGGAVRPQEDQRRWVP